MGQLIRVGIRMDLVEAEAFNRKNHFFQAQHWYMLYLGVWVGDKLPQFEDLFSLSLVCLRDITHLLENLTDFYIVEFLLIKLSYIENQRSLQGLIWRSPMQILMNDEIEILLNFLACVYYTLCGNRNSLCLNSIDLFILELLSPLLTWVPSFFCIFEEIKGCARSLGGFLRRTYCV